MPLDAASLRDTALDYTIRTLWALVVAVIALVIARAVRATAMRSLARHRAHANATVLIGNMPAARTGDSTAHGGVIVGGCPTVLIGG